MKYEFGRISKVQRTLVQPTKEDSYAMPSKVVMYPVFIDQEEERRFTKRANKCMKMDSRRIARKT